MRTAVVQLCRHGDIANLLPLALRWSRDQMVDWIVRPDFADLLEACSYVTPIYLDVGIRDVTKAVRYAHSLEYDRVVAAQVDGNPAGKSAKNFCLQNWRNAGCEALYHDPATRLLFDRRDREAEELAAQAYLPPGNGPVVGYCLDSFSSPLKEAGRLEEWLVGHFSGRRLMKLPKLARAHHLLGLIERCEVLISVDSPPLHLTFATRTPLVALSRSDPWSQSEQRSHWVGRLTYEEVATEDGMRRLGELVELARWPRMIHCVDWYVASGPGENERNERASQTWRQLGPGWITVAHQLEPTQRSSRDLGDTRRLPYLRDVVEHGLKSAREQDCLVLTNADSNLVPETTEMVGEAVAAYGSCYSQRMDVRIWKPMVAAELGGQRLYPGADLFAFTPAWWREHGRKWPDVLLGAEGWDFIARETVLRTGGVAVGPVVWHERHRAFWNDLRNIHANPAQQYNRRLCSEWAVENGLAERLCTKGPYLFQ